ncbi:MAG: DUF58 domain-containing protein [Anaerolineae bacterium]|nr:DUF58 domain-containing protein [Anaerolineae bacterium]
MPTKRSWGFLALAIGLYLLANQTQVGWVYIMADGLLAVLIVSFFYARGMLTPLQARRDFRNLSAGRENKLAQSADNNGKNGLELSPPVFYEDDALEVTLQFNHPGVKPAFLVSGAEFCPFAPPAEREQFFFIPGLFKGQPQSLSYQTRADRRGLYTFSKLPLRSKGPFGLFSLKRALDTPGQILIYPYYHPLQRLRLLETRELAERQTARVGVGSQVMSTREYRPGDSLRQIHWRSTARLSKLVVKEFAEEDQPSLTVALDLAAAGGVQDKFSPFETAIRLAASLGHYATRNAVPFRLVGASPRWAPPATPLGWWAILNYLAKVQPDGQEPLAKLLAGLPPFPFLVVLASHPDPSLARVLAALPRKGGQTLAVFITPGGAMPENVKVTKTRGLEVKQVSPYNWTEAIETW